MAYESLFSRPPSPALDTPMTEGQHSGDDRKEGELEDGEIDGEEEPTEEVKEETKEAKEEEEEEEEKPASEKPHKKSRKRKKKEREKKKRRRREKHKHSSAASDSSDNSYDSDTEHSERPHKPPMYRDYDSHFTQHGHPPGKYMTSPKSLHTKKNPAEYDDYSNYSDENYNEEEEEDFAEQLKHYRQAKENANAGEPPFKKPALKGFPPGAEQQQTGFYYGRGAGMVKKRKERGRGRGAHRGPNPYFQEGYQEDNKPMKKWVTMSQEFINQHTVERQGKQVCKYFLEGRCIKGEQCKFDHDAEVEKKKEMCKFYIQGFCTRGDSCIYLHSEFPCKFFHTGAKCYQGDNCKFSHEPLTDDSRELLHKVLHTEEESQHEEEEEPEEMQHQGGKFYNKPFMGMQFPGPPHPSMYNAEPLPESGSMNPPPQPMPMYGNPGMNSPFSPSTAPAHGPNHQKEVLSPPRPPYLHKTEDKPHAMQQQNSYQPVQSAHGFYENYYSQQAIHNVQSSTASEPMHKVFFSRIGKKMDGAEFCQPPPQRSMSREEDEFANWYSSEEEDGSGVSSILRTLRNQTKLARSNSKEQQSVTPISDPRLTKDRAPGAQPLDPRLRPTQGQSPGHHVDNVSSDMRVVHDPRKPKSTDTLASGHHVPSGGNVNTKGVDDDDEDGERELREKAAIIPLEVMPGVSLRDPRCKLRQFSHIKMDILLSKPNFAKLIVWAPEDLLPVPPPKPDPVSSINLPLPPLIADQRLGKSRRPGNELHQSSSDPRLERSDPRLEAKAKQSSMVAKGNFPDLSDSNVSINKPCDPRLQKSFQSRLHRSASFDLQPGAIKDSAPPKVDPRLAARSAMGLSAASVKASQDVLPPYAPKISQSSRLGTPGSILKNITLYSLRDNATTSSEPSSSPGENGDNQKKPESINKPCQTDAESVDSVDHPTCSSDAPASAKSGQSSEVSEDKVDCSDEKLELSVKPSTPQPSTAQAVHNLPIQALSGLIRPQYSEPRQVKAAGPPSQPPDTSIEGEVEDDDDGKPLKDVFKTFDPTASPFC